MASWGRDAGGEASWRENFFDCVAPFIIGEIASLLAAGGGGGGAKGGCKSELTPSMALSHFGGRGTAN